MEKITDNKIDDFLATYGLNNYKRQPLSGDASFRRYERILDNSKTYMLMVAPPEKEDVRPFIKVDEILINSGLNAPKILHKDVAAGLLLLEDYGDDLYSKVLAEGRVNELELYQLATDLLGKLPTKADITDYTTEKLVEEACLIIDWLFPDAPKDEFIAIWTKTLQSLRLKEKVLVLRDYHADNLMWLPQNDGFAKIGLLDFQDALMGNPAYDLVSLLEDARRDVTPEVAHKILAQKTADFVHDYFILGAQRNTKIIGIFNRLKKRDGKDNYLKFLPRVWAHLNNDLSFPALAEVRDFMTRYKLEQ
jgi:aminoglycoside/choline kinase family phosphotransferase